MLRYDSRMKLRIAIEPTMKLVNFSLKARPNVGRYRNEARN